MRVDFLNGVFLFLVAGFSSGVLAQDSELDLLRTELAELRSDYDARIADLEHRLALAEQNQQQASLLTQSSVPAVNIGSPSSNPGIGVIFTGSAWNYSANPDGYVVQGFPYGGEAGPISEGLALSETELIMNANVDDKFTAWLTMALAVEDGEAVVEIEEAWVEATALPAGFGAKFGRFFSSIGYLNSKHAHAWDFADQPLPYQAFLAGQLKDDGIQVRWLAPTDLFLELGGEAMRGGQYPASGAAHRQAIWKWAPNGNWKERNLILQAEYLQRREDGEYSGAGLSPTQYKVDQQGWYAQAVYQPVQRWRVGGRIDSLTSDNPGPAFAETLLAAPLDDPRRYSIMMDWANSEFSRLRLQFTRDEAGLIDDNQWGLQYIHSIGAHGAHTF